MGARITKYLSKEQITQNTGIAVYDWEIITEYPLHWHNYLELELILEGDGVQIINGERRALHRGCFSVLRQTDYHHVIPGENLRLLSMMVDDQLLSGNVLGQLMVPRTLFFELDEKETSILQSHFLLCMEENSRTEPDRIYLKHLIACVFLWILRHVPALEPGNTDLTNGIQTVLLYLNMHFRENPSLQEAAEVAHYNISHFSTTFHKQMKMPYSTYLNLLKLSYAKELLLSTDLKISDICYECGFTSQSNFLRLFKEQTGLTPSKFRGE